MERILVKIETESQKLNNSPLCHWLLNDKINDEDHLSFTPSMLFFVLGFKDILSAMHVSNPQTETDIEINKHCQEDLNHWKWYLRDLESLGFIPQSWGTRMSDMFQQIWGDESFEVRQLVYTVIHQVKKHNNPLMSLIIIEYLEAAFAVFIQHMLVPINKLGYYEQLEYFGKIHVEKEMAHSRGSWVEGQRSEPASGFKKHIIDDATLQQAIIVIDEISVQMQNVFNHWFSARKDFVRFAPTEAKQVSTNEEEKINESM